MQAPHTKGSFVLNSSLPTYVGIATLALCVVALLYVANWGTMHPSISNARVDYSDPDVYIKQLNSSIAGQSSSIPQKLKNELAQSRMYFMLSNKGSAYTQSLTLGNHGFSFLRNEYPQDAFYSYSTDGTHAAFFAVPSDQSTSTDEWVTAARLYTINATSLSSDGLVDDLTTSTIINADPIEAKQTPAISNSGNILFVGVHDGVWSVYLATASGTKVVGEGYSPRWISDTQFVYLKNDGLYSRNIDSEEESQLIAKTDISYASDRIDVSKDGSALVWTQLKQNQISLFSVVNDTSLPTLVQRGVINASAFWIAFSPNGSYLAAITTDPKLLAVNNEPHPRIEFFDLSNFTKVSNLSIDLSAFEPSHMRLTEWAKTSNTN